MAGKTPLRVVGDQEMVKKSKPLTVTLAAGTGDRRELLVSLRARIATDIDNPNTPSRDLAALSRRLLEIAKEIESIDSHSRGDEIGEAAATPDEEWAAT